MPELLGLLIVAAGAWLLWDGLRAREAANVAITAACSAERLLLLDYTVGLQSMWPMRDAEGRLVLRRVYGFEYSDTGHNRRKGTVTMAGARILTLYIGPRAVREGETLH